MKASRPLVSIILPVYNGERTLNKTIKSLMVQTYSHFELLIGIDGCTDGSKSLLEQYTDSRIRLFENQINLGLANNLNKLIGEVAPDSEYIAMAEQDDVYVPERIQWQVEVMLARPEVGLVSGIAEFISDGKNVLFPWLLVNKEAFPQGTDLFKYLYQHQLKVVNTCMMIRRAVHTKYGLMFNNTFGNNNVDWDYVLRFSLVSHVYGIPKVLVRMDRTSQNPSITSKKWIQFRASRQLLLDFKQEFPELITDKVYKEALKMHRKIELGYRRTWALVWYAMGYTLKHWDMYFLKYVYKRFKNYNN
ncbi:glycosyltransferase family 2 protein [Aestuariivivens sediminicola]|uniref:glycosyltransferase family 2 protein n=1 Tax=Aestuariivivens sediminicola TaxID=2913560 RepID=UPI001F5833A5|nr:glycosyltransferase [Aestuariivivens sediminicola]